MKTDATRPPPILIVDDDAGQRSLLETFLRAEGYRTQSAASGEAALQMLLVEPFAMMISDVRMPGMSGIETLRRVRQKHPALPVLLVTAFADIRSAVHGNYVIFFRYAGERFEVVNIFEGHRDIESCFDERGEP